MSASGIAPDSIPRGAMHCAANKGNCFDYTHVIFPYSSRVHFRPGVGGGGGGEGERDYHANRIALIVSKRNRDAR